MVAGKPFRLSVYVISAMHTISADILNSRYNRPGTVADHGPSLHLDMDESRHQQTLVALADVDAGRTLTDDEMETWMTRVFGPPPVSDEPA